MLAKSIGVPMFIPDLDLDVQVDQTSMAVVMNETDFHTHGETLFQPRTWYNAFQFHEDVGTEWEDGDLLIHFPGLEEDRWMLMEKWLNRIERSPETLDVAYEKTKYPSEVKAFWKMLRHAVALISRAQVYMEEGRKNMDFVADSALKVQHLIWGTEVNTKPGVDLMTLYKNETNHLEALLDKVI